MSNTEATLFPVGSHAPADDFPGLESSSFTAHKLKHSSPEHLNLTTRRFFIGPIPEGWLNSNRKSWYKRRLELSTYSSRPASFSAASGQTFHHRTVTGLDGSANTRMSFSFPQPEDIEEPGSNEDTAEDTEEDEDPDKLVTRQLEPVSTDIPQVLTVSEQGEATKSKNLPEQNEEATEDVTNTKGNLPALTKRPPLATEDSFWTAREHNGDARSQKSAAEQRKVSLEADVQRQSSNLERPSESATAGSLQQMNSLTATPDNVDASSRTALLPADNRSARPQTADSAKKKSLHQHEPAPYEPGSPELASHRRQSEGVRFRVSDAVADRQRRVVRRVDNTRSRIGNKIARRQTLLEGTIIKMEKMLVRIDMTMQKLSPEYDENESIRTETTVMEKWREYMVVARKSQRGDDEDYRLQFYQTRVIPEIDDASTKKKPKREIKLIRKTTRVNLFSSLDKTVVIWHPYKKGTRIIVIKAGSAAHSAEWYTFLRDALGWHRPSTLKVIVPDLDVSLNIEKPFEGLEAAGLGEEDEREAIYKVVEAEQAVASKIISQCINMLEGNPEWTSVMHAWHAHAKIGLAWKRYDRIEWVHGVNEQKMYGSMAMQHSYDLELRPKIHYPTRASSKTGADLEEPAPVEGFLIRLTSQKGIHKRMGKTFFKRLYFSTQDHFLLFSRPTNATPPHPPRLQTISGTNIPSSSEIISKTPTMYDITPFEVEDGNIKWLKTGLQDRINRRDREAYEEARRNVANLEAADGFINMCRVKNIRKMKWGADEVDEALESGSDVDFHEEVANTVREDGATREIDDNRTFEMILDNGLIIRLQAYNEETRNEWIKRLRTLVKYWKARKSADMDQFKSIRQVNLDRLKIDQEQEAELGQFGHKWEVSRSEASPEIYNICPVSSCRAITMSGLLYRKTRRHATFQRCGVILSAGKLLVFQSTLRKSTGAQVPHIHQEKQQTVDLSDCYVYSGLIVEDDLLYQNRTFDANHMGVMASLPRVWLEDGWTSSDVDTMCCFVVWMNTRKGWFRTAGKKLQNLASGGEGDAEDGQQRDQQMTGEKGTKRARLKRVKQLGVTGRGMVFKCRSRAERDLWVLNIASEIERVVEKRAWDEVAEGGGVRLEG